MRRILWSLCALVVVVAACGGSSPVAGAEAAESNPSTTAVAVPGPPAPDFELALGDGGTFTLSAELKPVYMVFWAEW